MPVVAIVVETLLAFSNSDKVVIPACRTHIKEISPSFTCLYPFAVKALVTAIVTEVFIVVRHNSFFSVINLIDKIN